MKYFTARHETSAKRNNDKCAGRADSGGKTLHLCFLFLFFLPFFFVPGTGRASAPSDLINSNVLGTFFEPDSEGQRKIPACQSMSDETLICNPICT